MYTSYSTILFTSTSLFKSAILFKLAAQLKSSTQRGLLSIFFLLSIVSVSPADNYNSPDTIAGTTKIDAESLIELALENKDLVIIDSRIKSDRHQGYISDSISLPDTETNCVSLLSLVDNDDTPIVFYCNGPKCRRSDRAVIIAVDCGYKKVYWFRGGFEEWQSKKYLINK